MKKMMFAIMLMISVEPTSAETDYRDEIIDWSLITGAAAGSLAVPYLPISPDKPLLGGPTDKSYRDDTVPWSWVVYACVAGGVSTAVLPNSDGQFNRTAYRNVKGFAAAVSFNAFLTMLTKETVGRRRPSYDNYPDKKDAQKSFYSGHTSFSFAAASYLSMYVINNTGDGKGYEILPKAGVSVLMMTAASAVAVSRVRDNKHHISDVAVGGLMGAMAGVLSYRWANGSFSGNGSPSLSVGSGNGDDFIVSAGYTF